MGGYTKVDNWLFDTVLPAAKPGTFKLVASVYRATVGWRKEWATISLSDFQRLSGTDGRHNVVAAIKDAIENGWIERRPEGREFVYRVVTNRDQHSHESLPEQSRIVTDNSHESLPSTSGLNKTIKKEDTVTNVTVANGVATEQPALFVLPEPPAESGKPKGRGKQKPKENPEAAAKTKDLLDRYGEALGCEIPSYPQEGAAAKRILKNYTAEDAIGCYRWLKADRFWHGKHLSLASVNRQLGEWVKQGRPSPANGANGHSHDLLWVSEFLPYLNGTKQFAQLSPLVQQGIREQGESNVKKQPPGVTKKQFNDFLAARH